MVQTYFSCRCTEASPSDTWPALANLSLLCSFKKSTAATSFLHCTHWSTTNHNSSNSNQSSRHWAWHVSWLWLLPLLIEFACSKRMWGIARLAGLTCNKVLFSSFVSCFTWKQIKQTNAYRETAVTYLSFLPWPKRPRCLLFHPPFSRDSILRGVPSAWAAVLAACTRENDVCFGGLAKISAHIRAQFCIKRHWSRMSLQIDAMSCNRLRFFDFGNSQGRTPLGVILTSGFSKLPAAL